MIDTRITAGRIRKALYGISDNYDACLQPARRGTGSHVTVHLTNPPPPIDADILDKRVTAHLRLASWSKLVITGRDLHRIPAVDVLSLTAFLQIHVDWLASHELGPAAAAQLEGSAAALGTIAADNAPHRFGVGDCPGSSTNQAGLQTSCVGVLRVVLRRDDDLLPSVLACTIHPVEHTWAAGQWRVLDRLINVRPVLVQDEAGARRLAEAIRK